MFQKHFTVLLKKRMCTINPFTYRLNLEMNVVSFVRLKIFMEWVNYF